MALTYPKFSPTASPLRCSGIASALRCSEMMYISQLLEYKQVGNNAPTSTTLPTPLSVPLSNPPYYYLSPSAGYQASSVQWEYYYSTTIPISSSPTDSIVWQTDPSSGYQYAATAHNAQYYFPNGGSPIYESEAVSQALLANAWSGVAAQYLLPRALPANNPGGDGGVGNQLAPPLWDYTTSPSSAVYVSIGVGQSYELVPTSAPVPPATISGYTQDAFCIFWPNKTLADFPW